jgi:hypothetical protein
MSSTEAEGRHSHGTKPEPADPVEAIVGAIPLVLPLIGGVLIFLLAFIAVYLA